MSDFQKALKKVDSRAKIKTMEVKEGAEQIRDTIKAGSGDIVKGAAKRGLKKEGLATQLAKQQKTCAKR